MVTVVMGMPLTNNEAIRKYWEQSPLVYPWIHKGVPAGTREWFEDIEEHRYTVEPFIHSVAQFTRHHGKNILEVGVGAGTDLLQFARAGAQCHGVDLTDAAIQMSRARLAMYGFDCDLRRVDAEVLPFPDDAFDVVYSWGVIHHSAHPERIVGEIRRVLKPGGEFIGMMYGRRSVLVFKLWVRHGLLVGRPWRRFADVLWHHQESVGTKAYTVPELHALFSQFASVAAEPIITPYDRSRWPRWLSKYFPNSWGWFITLRAVK
jgi:SAM-dependent methyltransferase